jgi:hypothetical protein
MRGSQTIVEALKEKLWKKTCTAMASTRLELGDETGAIVADLDRDAAPLANILALRRVRPPSPLASPLATYCS